MAELAQPYLLVDVLPGYRRAGPDAHRNARDDSNKLYSLALEPVKLLQGYAVAVPPTNTTQRGFRLRPVLFLHIVKCWLQPRKPHSLFHIKSLPSVKGREKGWNTSLGWLPRRRSRTNSWRLVTIRAKDPC
jgi:hypothetical protein